MKLKTLMLAMVMLFTLSALSACKNEKVNPPSETEPDITQPTPIETQQMKPNPKFENAATISTDKNVYVAGEILTVSIEILDYEPFPEENEMTFGVYDPKASNHEFIEGEICGLGDIYEWYFLAPEKAGEYEIRLYASEDGKSNANNFAKVITVTVVNE